MSFLALVLVVSLVMSGCGSGDRVAQGPGPSAPLFSATRDEVTATSEAEVQIAETVSQALDTLDSDSISAVFGPSGYVVDPIVPEYRPSIAPWLPLFRRLCSGVRTHDIYVNVGGSVFAGDCSGFYDGYVDDPPASLPVLSELWVEDGTATRLMNRLDAPTLGRYPAETSAVIGFVPSEEAAVSAAAQTAERFASKWVDAWHGGDLEPMVALYAPEGVRIDGFAGLDDDPAALAGWLESFTNAYDEVTVQIELLTASALGPAAAYRLELGNGDGACEMRLVSVWDLDEQDRILREHTYYDPETVFACGWQKPTS